MKNNISNEKGEKTKRREQWIDVLKKKWLVDSTKTILLVAIIIAVYIGINIVLNKVVLPEWDGTTNKIYSLSQETKDKVGNIHQDITITLINYSNSSVLMDMIEKYVRINNHIKIETIDDLSTRSDLMRKYSLEATDNLIIIACGENETTLSEYDLYTYDYSTYQEVDRTEEALTNAIVTVSLKEKTKIYFMNTHLAYTTNYYSSIMQAMQDEGNEIELLDILSKGEVPEDCDCLIISTLQEDLTEWERDKVIEYIQNGGNILLLCGPNIANVDLKNFQTVLDQYGITISNSVIFEGNPSNMVSGYPDFIIEETQSSSLTQRLRMNLNLCFIDAGKITFEEDKLEELGVEYETLAVTSEDSYERTDLTQNSATRTAKDGNPESLMIAAIASKKIGEETTSKLIVYSNELFAMNYPIQSNGYTMYTVNLYNNEDLILNSVAYLTEREDTITIRKDLDSVTYTVSEQQNRIIMAVIFILPMVIIFIGIIVWQMRRRKK